MLARIERVEGVEWAGVEATGRFLAVRLREGEAAAQVAAAVAELLGPRGRRAGEALAVAQTAARERGDPWLASREVHALSYIEGRLVAVHAAGKVGAELGLDGATRDALAECVRVVFFAVLERVHAEGGRESSSWFYREWPKIAREVAARMAGSVPDAARLEERVAACYARAAK